MDIPFKSVVYPHLQSFGQMASNVLIGKKPFIVSEGPLQRIGVLARKGADPFDTFNWLMDKAEKRGVKSAFYSEANVKRRKYDPHCSLDNPSVKERINMILEMGHEIGFHPGYYIAENREEWGKEWWLLRSYLPDVSIKGGRQHFLKFRIPLTWSFWEEAGLQYDSSLFSLITQGSVVALVMNTRYLI